MNWKIILGRATTAVLLGTLVACAQTTTVSREQVVENLDPIVKVEERGRMLVGVIHQLPAVVEIDSANAKKLKEHYDVYHVYHSAATVSLAQGNFQAYEEHLRVASGELDSIEETLKGMVGENSPEGPAAPRHP